jgi:hypothetical protein
MLSAQVFLSSFNETPISGQILMNVPNIKFSESPVSVTQLFHAGRWTSAHDSRWPLSQRFECFQKHLSVIKDMSEQKLRVCISELQMPCVVHMVICICCNCVLFFLFLLVLRCLSYCSSSLGGFIMNFVFNV